mmetsp:Transcript_22716/g.89847  ORF Transcript_22716/g.89847 Transcript_22716/m.89847 type:complete len:554 (-) Transcript_22716:74-1735(-)|eukprot:CAMPEP_0114621332 /NCGR_PEP_ID=MMETSP0168-20121206/9176_1 /TAXON_ID=95228 ORGANISM="Vannella sp., Strain DIVA3 517/6/12" /NCGR_SAMPLE_ID=MMETSP0168 /ASSEMBLY_ACC=CAM_ASM_000044 /LENGTH=553 /DNA_ID=CAMNT_0001832531 /DNA_START=183 /DNA_END=1844 /DNA_ORIENTATION=+
MGGSRAATVKPGTPRGTLGKGEEAFVPEEDSLVSGKQAFPEVIQSDPCGYEQRGRGRPKRKSSLAEMFTFARRTSSSKLTEATDDRPRRASSGKQVRSPTKPPKSPKLFRLRGKNSSKNRNRSMPEVADVANMGRRGSAVPLQLSGDQGFIITPPDSYDGKHPLKEMVRRLKSYHSVSVGLETLPQLVVSSMVTLSVHTSFPPSLYLYMLARNDGNPRGACEDLVNLGWSPHLKESDSKQVIARTADNRKDEHFTTPYYHGNIDLPILVKKIRGQSVGSYLTYCVSEEHLYQYYCLFVSKNPVYTSQRDANGNSPRSVSPPGLAGIQGRTISPGRNGKRTMINRSHLCNSRGSPDDSHGHLSGDARETGVIVCIAIDGPGLTEDERLKNDCLRPLKRHQQPTSRFVPFLTEHACQRASEQKAKQKAEDPSYVLELLAVLTAPLPLEQRIFKYKAKLHSIEEELEGMEPDNSKRANLVQCCADIKDMLQQLKLSLYGQEEEEKAKGETCGFLSFSASSLTEVTTSNSLVAEQSNMAMEESKSLTVGFLWAVDDP